MFTCFSAVQRSANMKTATNKHKSVGPRLREGRSTVGEALLSLRPAPSQYYRWSAWQRHSLCQLANRELLPLLYTSFALQVQPLIMSDAPAPVAQAKAPAKKAAKPRKPTKPADHPKYNVMIAARHHLPEGARVVPPGQAVLKYIMANYKVGNEVAKINARVKTALKAGVKAGTLKQAKGTGASGSFRLGEKKVAAAKPKKAKKPKAAAKKPKVAKKPKAAGAKKPKSPKEEACRQEAQVSSQEGRQAQEGGQVARQEGCQAQEGGQVARQEGCQEAGQEVNVSWLSTVCTTFHIWSSLGPHIFQRGMDVFCSKLFTRFFFASP